MSDASGPTPGREPELQIRVEPRRIGVCSWSLQATDATDLTARIDRTGLKAVQLALTPIAEGRPGFAEDAVFNALQQAGFSVLSGMMEPRGEDYSTLESIQRTGGLRPDEHWEHNQRHARHLAELCARRGIGLVTFHAGFIPHDARNRERATMLDRIRRVVEIFDAQDVIVALETGQETAETLLEALDEIDHPMVGVNFDPANMILYGMGDPVRAVADLADYIEQVHIKDATATTVPGTWGSEVPAGSGQVRWEAFFGVLEEYGVSGDLVIEREAGDQRIADVATGAALVRRLASNLA
ncbi:MAG: sugar phosphate isomerase/epimerase [Planctomycetaceae bacterium]|jgi:L-ribulose-5-phosphate 3-epimerase|nr:sugar phosphate isomerase/epimerase [Planctomycetaceae bacterium]